MRKLHKIISPLLLSLASIIAVTLLAVGCRLEQKTSPVVAVSIRPQKYILEKIAGNKIEVVCLLENGSNPENYEPKINDMLALEHCDAYFTIGNIGYEYAIQEKVKNNNANLKIYDTSKGISLMKSSDKKMAEYNPHVWTSVKNAKIIASNMHHALIELFPNNKKYFNVRYNKLLAHLDSLDSQFAHELKQVEKRPFIVWHPSLSYLSRDYGLTQVALDIQHLNLDTIDAIKAQGGKTIFVQPQFDGRKAELLSMSLPLTKVEINLMDEKWEEQMKTVVNALASQPVKKE